MAVRLTQKDKDKLKRINNSVRRKNKQMDNYKIGFNMETLPISKVTSRKQLNDYFDKARTYTRGYAYKYKKNKYNVVASNIEIQKAKRLAQEVTKDRARRFRKVAPEDFKSYGKKTGSSVMQRKLMGDDRYDMYDPVKFNFSSLRNRKQFEGRVKNLEKQLSSNYIDKKNKILKENLIKAMKNSWGKYGRTARKWLNSLSPDKVLEKFLTEDVFDFDFIYDENQIARQVEEFMATFNIA